MGLSIREVAPDFANAIEDRLRKVFETGEHVSNVELQGVTLQEPDHLRKWLCSFYPLRGKDETESAVTLLIMDITHRKRAEDALGQSESRNRDLVDHSVYGISRVAAHRTFLDENPALLFILSC